MTSRKNLGITLAVVAVSLTSVLLLSSWERKQPHIYSDKYGDERYDTVPGKSSKEKKIRDLDDVIDELNEVDLKVSMDKVKKEIEESMKKIDKEKIRIDVEKAMKEIDIEKIKRDVETSIAKIDWEEMKAELERVKEIDMKKLELDMKKMEIELSKIGPEIERSMEKAKVEIEKAKVEMKEYDEFVDGLEKDGMLNRKSGYTIKHKDGELFINDKKATDAVYNKYRSFLGKHKKFTIEKSDDDFNIDID